MFNLNKRPKALKAIVDYLKELQNAQMDLDLPPTDQQDALDEAVSQFRDKFPTLFLEEIDKREYATKHILMVLHRGARKAYMQRTRMAKKNSGSKPSQASSTTPRVTRSAANRAAALRQSSILSLNDDDEEGQDDDDELDQLSVFDRRSPLTELRRVKTEDSDSPTYIASTGGSTGCANCWRVIEKSVTPRYTPSPYGSPNAVEPSTSVPPSTLSPGGMPTAMQPLPSQTFNHGPPVNLSVGSGVTISISSGSHGANMSMPHSTPAHKESETGANFIYEFLSTCQPPLTTLLPKFMNQGYGSRYYLRGISTWDPDSRRALLKRIVTAPVNDGSFHTGEKFLPVMVDVLEHQLAKYFPLNSGGLP